MKPLIVSVLLLIASLNSFAQTDLSIKKAYAFYNVSMPGMQMADEHGNPITPKPNINRFIYIEYSGAKMPDIKAVLYKGAAMSFSVTPITATNIFVGDKKISPNYSITAKKGNKLLKIDLQPEEGKAMPEVVCKTIVIKSKQGSKLCKFYVMGEKQFSSPPAY